MLRQRFMGYVRNIRKYALVVACLLFIFGYKVAAHNSSQVEWNIIENEIYAFARWMLFRRIMYSC